MKRTPLPRFGWRDFILGELPNLDYIFSLAKVNICSKIKSQTIHLFILKR